MGNKDMNNNMDNNCVENSLYQRIVSEYLDCDSIEQTAKTCGTSKVTVRRVLITEGLWCSKTSIAVGELHDEGLSVAEIAEELCVTENAVKAYLPYTKGMYGESLTGGAERVKRYRERKEAVAEKMKMMSRDLTDIDEEPELPGWYPVIEAEDEADTDAPEVDVESYVDNDPEESWEDKLKRWEIERKERLNAQCEAVRRDTEGLWEAIHPEPQALDSIQPPRLLRLRIELLGFGENDHGAPGGGVPGAGVPGDGVNTKERAELNERILKAAKAEKGISREIVVPSNMTLHALHYAIQRLFGFLGYHMRDFYLHWQDFELVTAARLGGYVDLCGILFRYSDRYEDDDDWDNDYDGESSVNTWVKKMYRGPYRKGAVGDTWYANRRDTRQLYTVKSNKEKSDKAMLDKGKPELKEDMLLLEADEIIHPERKRNFLRGDIAVGELLTSTGKIKTAGGILDFASDRREALKIWKADILSQIGACKEAVWGKDPIDGIGENLIHSMDVFCDAFRGDGSIGELDDAVAGYIVPQFLFGALAVHPLPFFKEIYYSYDYGDGWQFKISAVDEYAVTDDSLSECEEEGVFDTFEGGMIDEYYEARPH
ncbi:MAG: hypothetical protein LIP11_16095 [Clostridiales bacterium]|nr:hypothetical protein [Clostridiales bacterium]